MIARAEIGPEFDSRIVEALRDAPRRMNMAAAIAHQAVADLLRAGEMPAFETGSASATDAGFTVTVTIGIDTKDQSSPPAAEVRLSELQKDAIAAAPSRLHNPVSLKKLAALSGYCYNSYFRDAVNRMVDMGLLRRVTGGIKRP